ncbi:hypothetical protein Fot_39581 [Forsythia ovata]|uniref:Uncharacterized protein n=1 Tax=Forsythia ovata TaxID=205694 RepID=A0ABD1S6J3_9LAMI
MEAVYQMMLSAVTPQSYVECGKVKVNAWNPPPILLSGEVSLLSEASCFKPSTTRDSASQPPQLGTRLLSLPQLGTRFLSLSQLGTRLLSPPTGDSIFSPLPNWDSASQHPPTLDSVSQPLSTLDSVTQPPN